MPLSGSSVNSVHAKLLESGLDEMVRCYVQWAESVWDWVIDVPKVTEASDLLSPEVELSTAALAMLMMQAELALSVGSTLHVAGIAPIGMALAPIVEAYTSRGDIHPLDDAQICLDAIANQDTHNLIQHWLVENRARLTNLRKYDQAAEKARANA